MSSQTLLSATHAMTARMASDLPEDGHPARRSLLAEITRLGSVADALSAMERAPDPTATAAANTKRLMTAATKLLEQSASARDRVHTILRGGLTDLDRRIAAKVNLKPDAYAPEIRSGFRPLGGVNRQRLLNDLASQNRGPELAALILAPLSTTGLTQEDCNKARDLIISTHAHAEHEETQALWAAFNLALDVLAVVDSFASLFIDPRKRQEIEKSETQAAAAVAAFQLVAGA